jgi:hypothetical protein
MHDEFGTSSYCRRGNRISDLEFHHGRWRGVLVRWSVRGRREIGDCGRSDLHGRALDHAFRNRLHGTASRQQSGTGGGGPAKPTHPAHAQWTTRTSCGCDHPRTSGKATGAGPHSASVGVRTRLVVNHLPPFQRHFMPVAIVGDRYTVVAGFAELLGDGDGGEQPGFGLGREIAG